MKQKRVESSPRIGGVSPGRRMQEMAVGASVPGPARGHRREMDATVRKGQSVPVQSAEHTAREKIPTVETIPMDHTPTPDTAIHPQYGCGGARRIRRMPLGRRQDAILCRRVERKHQNGTDKHRSTRGMGSHHGGGNMGPQTT